MDSTTSNRPQMPIQLQADNIANFLSQYDNFLMDCDGVFWDMALFQPFKQIVETVIKLRSQGKRFFMVTNNSRHSRKHLQAQFKTAGIEMAIEEAFPIPYVTAVYLKEVVKLKGKVYIVGGQSLAEEFDSLGIEHIGSGPDPDPVAKQPADLLKQRLDPEVKAVIVAYDENFSYNKAFKAASYLSNPECMYMATASTEKNLMLAPGYQQPLVGSMVACVNAASNRQPTVIGKPNHYPLTSIQAKNPDMDLSRTIMVGDTLLTDILFAKNCGIASLLVLSGCTSLQDLEHAVTDVDSKEHSAVPDYYVNNFADLDKLL